MTTIRPLIFSTVLLVASGVFASCVAPNDSLRVQDRIAIEQLMWDYVRALDSGNAEAYAATFAPDGQFGRGENAVKGRETLKKMISDARQKFDAGNESGENAPRMYHVVTNTHIEFIDEEHARYHAYWLGALTAGGTTSAGREVNELVRINGRWLISVRDVAPRD